MDNLKPCYNCKQDKLRIAAEAREHDGSLSRFVVCDNCFSSNWIFEVNFDRMLTNSTKCKDENK